MKATCYLTILYFGSFFEFFSNIFHKSFWQCTRKVFGNFVQHGLVGRLKEKGFSVTDHGDITLERVGGMNIHTVKKGYRFSRPHPGCHLPHSPWIIPGQIPARESLLQCSPSFLRESLKKIKNRKTAFFAALLIWYLIIFVIRRTHCMRRLTPPLSRRREGRQELLELVKYPLSSPMG